jgi:predicted Zn-dependent peptidase
MAPQLPSPSKEKVLIYNRSGLHQTELTLACRLPNFDRRGVGIQRVLASLVGSEVYTRVRGEAGAAYSVDGGPKFLRGGAAHMALTMMVDDTRLRDVLRVIRAHWARLADGQFDPGALSQVKWGMTASANFDFQTTSEVALRATDALNLGLSLEMLDREAQEISKVDTEQLKAAFRVCASSTILQLVGDESRIRSAL